MEREYCTGGPIEISQIALLIGGLLTVLILGRWLVLRSARWMLSTEPSIARQEILALVPRGTDLAHAQTSMQQAGFHCKLMPNGLCSEPWGSGSLFRPAPVTVRRDFLYCDREDKRGRWQVALTYRADHVTDVLVAYSFGME